MCPVLFTVGPVTIWSYGTFMALGMITLFAMALITARREGRRWEHLLPMAMGVAVGGVFGARLSHLIVEPGRFTELADFYSLFNLVLLFLLWRLRQRTTRENALLYLYFAAYAFFRFWLEFMADYPPIAFGLTGVQVLCLAILAGLGIGLWRGRPRTGRALPATGAPP